MQASVTTWKSIGYRPGAYTDTTRAATSFARRSAAVRWAKSRHTPSRPSNVAIAPSIGRDEPVTYAMLVPTQLDTPASRSAPSSPANSARASGPNRSDSQYRLGRM